MQGSISPPFPAYNEKNTKQQPKKGEKQVYDRGLSVLEQYGLESRAVYRGRGSLICDTDKGFVLIKEFCGTAKKLESQASLLTCISEKSQILTDKILPNKEGAYITLDKEEIPYIVKQWYEGKECDTRCEADIYTGIAAMADLHRVMQMPVQMHYVREPLYSEFRRHNAELRKIRKFVYTKRRKMILNFNFWKVSAVFWDMERKLFEGWKAPVMKIFAAVCWNRGIFVMGNLTSIMF